MNWDLFWTIVLQLLIVLVILFVGSAVVSAIWDGVRGKRPKE